jgi:hypothetical protein
VKNAPANIRANADPARVTDMVSSFHVLLTDTSRTGARVARRMISAATRPSRSIVSMY